MNENAEIGPLAKSLMQKEPLKLTRESLQALVQIFLETERANLELRAELEQVKRERDEALGKVKKYDFICSIVTESVCQQQSEFSALKTKYVLPTMIAYADFCGQISFDDALNILITQSAAKLRQGGE